jgi:hypothetical protein
MKLELTLTLNVNLVKPENVTTTSQAQLIKTIDAKAIALIEKTKGKRKAINAN